MTYMLAALDEPLVRMCLQHCIGGKIRYAANARNLLYVSKLFAQVVL